MNTDPDAWLKAELAKREAEGDEKTRLAQSLKRTGIREGASVCVFAVLFAVMATLPRNADNSVAGWALCVAGAMLAICGAVALRLVKAAYFVRALGWYAVVVGGLFALTGLLSA